MLGFTNYITEAKVSKQNLDKVADVFKRIFEKEFRTKLFRFGGPRGFAEIKNGIGILYIYNRNKAMRLNYVKGEIKSITLWKNFKLGRSGDFTIDLDGLGLLAAGKHLFKIIRDPKTGVTTSYGEYLEEGYAGMLNEAKRISKADFVELVRDNLPNGMQINNLSWDIITSIAVDNDRLLPSGTRRTKISGRGKTSRFDITQLLMDKDADKPAKKSETAHSIKVSAQDTNTVKHMSMNGNKKADKMLSTVKDAIENPDYKKQMLDANTLFGRMRNLVQVVCRGARNSLVIYGGPGIGKTYVVTQTIGEEGLAKGKDWYVIKGRITTSALYQTLFMHRKGSLLVFDDTDSVWGDAEASNILKAALDSYEERVISWVSPKTTNVSKMSEEDKEAFNDNLDDKLDQDPEAKVKLPSEFIFDGKIVFISNLPYEKFDEAVLNRSAKIDMTLTQEQLFERMESILEHLGDKSVDMEIKKEILDFLKKQHASGALDSASMRTYVAAEDLYRSGLDNWKELLDYV